jgi:hypothetical protein
MTDKSTTPETTHSNPEDTREVPSDVEQPREPSLSKTVDEEASEATAADSKDVDRETKGELDASGASGVSDVTDDADRPPGDDVLESPEPAAAAPTGGFAAGAAAVVSAGLGLASLTGTSLGDMLQSRRELIGQIETSTGGSSDQINAFYSAPWHTAAVLNGVFAFAAVIIGGVLLAAHARRADTRPWTKAVALGGVILGAIGLLVAGGMYLDLFASTPELPEGPS